MIQKRSGKLAQSVEEQIRNVVGQTLVQYTQMEPDKRLEYEQQGINLAKILSDNILPAINQLSVKRLLIIMEEGIGNMVMLTPALRMLKHLNPLLHITVWGKEPAVQVIDGWECVDNVITEFDNSFYDLCYYTIWSTNTAQKYGGILNQFCKNHLKSELNPHRHESIQHNIIADFLGAYGDLAKPHCERIRVEEEEAFEKKLADAGLSTDEVEKYIIFGDTALRLPGGEWDVKRWPHYHELSELIRRKFPEYKIIMIGDETDKREAERMKWPENVNLNLMGKLNIRELAELISFSEMYIGNDTGPTHIAAAVGTKTYAIFAPTILGKNMPVGDNVTIINKQFPCSPCQYTERFKTCECMGNISAQEVYNEIFFPPDRKPKVMLVGDFSGGAHRNEVYIKRTLEKDFGHKVIPFEIRPVAQKEGPHNATFRLVSMALHHAPDYILICGGHEIVPDILAQLVTLLPKTKILNWYVDNRGQVEPWFAHLCMACHASYWSTGDPYLLSNVFSQTQKPVCFLPITPDDKEFFPIEGEKDIDVLFVGTPHSAPRLNLLKYLIDNKVNLQIYGNGKWPEEFKKHVKPGVFGPELNKVLNRAKIVLNTNIINEVPLYFSDRYFFPMVVQTVGLNQRVPLLEDMFEDGKHMAIFDNPEDCLVKINELLADDKKREDIGIHGNELYKTKYTLADMLERMFEYAS